MTTPSPHLVGLAVVQTLGYAIFYYIFIALNQTWATDFEWSLAQVNGAFTLALVSQALTAPILGQLIDRDLSRWIIPIGLALASCLLALMTLHPNLILFYAIWVGMGVCWGASLYDPCFAFLVRACGSRARRAITLVTLIAGFASTLSFPFNRWMTMLDHWELGLLIQAGIGLFIVSPLAWFSTNRRALQSHFSCKITSAVEPSTHVNIEPSNPRLDRSALFDLALLSLGFGIVSAVHYGFLSVLFPIFEHLGLQVGVATVLASLLGPMQVVGRAVLMLAPADIRMIQVSLFCTLTLIFGFAVLLSVTSMTVAIVFVVGAVGLFVGASGASNGVLGISRPLSIAEALGAERIGTMGGVIALPSGIAVAVAPYVFTLVVQTSGYPALLGSIVIALMVGVLAFLMILKRQL